MEERARRYIVLGAVASGLGLLLFAGLSSRPVGVLLGVVAVIACPLSVFWDDRTERLTKRAILIFLAIMSFWLIAFPLAHGWGIDQVGRILRWVAILIGPSYAWVGLRSLRLLTSAHDSLRGPIYNVRVEAKILKSYGALTPSKAPARIWPSNSARLEHRQIASPLAQFGWQQLSQPELVQLDMVSAKVYGAPAKGAVVVVSCPKAVLVGRLKWSHFSEPASSKPISPLLAWLFKPRSLRLLNKLVS